jgi:hypothetical protein
MINMDFQINIKNLEEFKRLAKKAPEAVESEFSKALNKIAAETEKMAVERARSLKIYSTGNLINQIRQKRIAKLAYAVISGAEYSIYVEKGRKPGAWPPYQPIYEWVRRHYKRFSSFKTKGSKGAQKDIKRATFLVQRKIARKGIAPRPYMEYTWDRMQSRADKHLDRALNNLVKNLAA